MKKKVLFYVLLNIICINSFSQQLPHYTQYILNSYIINPAVAGIENYTDVKLSHRHQWVGIDGAPVTTYFTIHQPLKKRDYETATPTGFHYSNENPRGSAYWDEYTKPENHAGIGFTVLNDRTGPLNRFAAMGTYSYHLGVAAKTTLAMGVSAGIKSISLNTNKLNFDVPIDPAVAGSGYLNKLSPDLSLGLWLYSSDYFAGLSFQNVFPTKVKYAEDTVKLTGSSLVPHTFLTAGYRMFLNDDVSFLPSILLKYVGGSPLSFDLNSKFQYHDLLWLGASYRYRDSWAGMVGVNISNAVNVSYSHDITVSRLNAVSKGSHEIVVGFLLGNKWGDWCPRNLW